MCATAATPKPLTKASWIWPEGHMWDLHNCYALFRKEFDLGAVPKKAPLFITADQSYRLWINGEHVCRGPARGFQSRWPYDEVDVAAHLRKGRNVIAIRAYNPGMSNFQYLCQGYAGLLAGAKWGKVEIVTDGSWHCVRDPAVIRDTVPTSLQLFPQEWHDARKEITGWMAAGFDDGAWEKAHTRLWNAPPWYSIEPRAIPMLAEKEMDPIAVVGEAFGNCTPDYLATRNVAQLRGAEEKAHEPPKDGRIPLVVPKTGKGCFRSYVLDFGRIVVGSLSLKVSGCKGGEIVDTLHVETIDEGKRAPDIFYPGGCNASFGYRMVCRQGETQHAFHHYYGFRFLVITVRDSESELTVAPKLQWVGYPLDRKGKLVTSEHDLSRIWEACAWTQQCCMTDSYMDTPWREQAQWWGDARVQGQNTFHLAGDARLIRRGIRSIAGQLTPDGLTYGHAPTMAHNCVLPDFTLIWILTVWDHYWQTGTIEAFEEHRGVVEGALAYFARCTNPKNGLVKYDPRYWLFLDWTGLFKDGYSAVYNLWLLLALEKAAILYGLAGYDARCREMARWAGRLRADLKPLIGDDGLVRDGLTWKGKVVPSCSIHAQTLAMAADLSPSTEGAMLKKAVLPYLRGEAKPEVEPSAYWITYVFSEAISRGYGADVVECIRRRWLPMAEFGTTWEGWQKGRGGGSCSHAWSAHPLYHLMNTVGGVRQIAAGWREILFDPVFVGSEGGATIPTPQGEIVSRWRKQASSIEVGLSLPPKVRAKVRLPGVKEQTVKGKAEWTVQQP